VRTGPPGVAIAIALLLVPAVGISQSAADAAAEAGTADASIADANTEDAGTGDVITGDGGVAPDASVADGADAVQAPNVIASLWTVGDSTAEPREDGDGRSQPIAAGLGRLRVVVNRPDTHLYIDDVDVGVVPLERDLRPGTHALRLESPFQRTWRGSVTIRAGELVPLRAFLRPATSRANAVVATVVASMIITGGGILGALSLADRGALDQARNEGRLDDRDPRIDRGMALAGLADLAFGLGGVTAIVGGYFFFAEPGPPSIARPGRTRRLPVLP